MAGSRPEVRIVEGRRTGPLTLTTTRDLIGKEQHDLAARFHTRLLFTLTPEVFLFGLWRSNS